MKTMFLNTTSSTLQVCFKNNSKVIEFNDLDDMKSQSQIIIDAIDSVLDGVSVKDLDFIVVVNGPGSFTGIRLGLSVVKGFMLAVGVRVLPINTFEAIYTSLVEKDNNDIIYFCLDAGGEEAFVAKGQNGKIFDISIVNKEECSFDGMVVSDFLKGSNVLNPIIHPDRVLNWMEENVDLSSFVQKDVIPLYVKPHYAKIKKV